MSNETKVKEIISKLKAFEEEFGDDLDACHPAAFDVIYDIIKTPDQALDDIKSQLMEFNEEFMEDVESCNEDGCVFLKNTLKSIDIF